MSLERLVDDVDPAARAPEVVQTIVIQLTPADTRKIIEHILGGPAIRVYITQEEAQHLENRGVAPDFTAHKLSDGRFACWRPASELDACEPAVRKEIEARILPDDAT